MLIHTAHLVCRADVVDEFRARLVRHAATSRERESGCHRFDVHQEKSNPTLFFLYEVYADDAALEQHRASEHYAAYRRDTANWVVSRTWWFWQAC